MRIVQTTIILMVFINSIAGQTLIFVQSISRHGARYPLRPRKNDNSWLFQKQNITGELTSQAKHQHYVLGRILYEKYWKLLFSGTKYEFQYHQSQILVRSTSKNRTLDSMQAQIVGLLQALPPRKLPKSQRERALPVFVNASDYDLQSEGQEYFYVFGKNHKYFQTLSIYGQKSEVNAPKGIDSTIFANPYDEGDFLHKYLDQNCPNQREWVTANVASQRVKDILERKPIKTFFQELGKVTEDQIDFNIVDDYIDDYHSLKNMGLPYLPFFDQPHNARTAEFLSEIHFLARLMLTEKQVQVCTANLLDTTVNNMKKGATGEGPKFVLYSSHQTTMVCLLTALKMTSLDCTAERYFNPSTENDEICIDTIPMFGATIIFELYRNLDASLAFKILYNGIPMKIPVCGNKIICPLEEFQSWNENFSPIDPNILCGIEKASEISPVNIPWPEIYDLQAQFETKNQATRKKSLIKGNFQETVPKFLSKENDLKNR